MCVVSMIGDHYRDKFDPYRDSGTPPFAPPQRTPDYADIVRRITGDQTVTREEFDSLKREIAEMKELITKARAYDAANGEPACENDEKLELLRKIAEKVGITL